MTPRPTSRVHFGWTGNQAAKSTQLEACVPLQGPQAHTRGVAEVTKGNCCAEGAQEDREGVKAWYPEIIPENTLGSSTLCLA